MNGWVCLWKPWPIQGSDLTIEAVQSKLPLPVGPADGSVVAYVVEAEVRGTELWGHFVDPARADVIAKIHALTDKYIAAVDPSRATGEDLQRLGDMFARDTTGEPVDPLGFWHGHTSPDEAWVKRQREELAAVEASGWTFALPEPPKSAEITLHNQGVPFTEEETANITEALNRIAPEVTFTVRAFMPNDGLTLTAKHPWLAAPDSAVLVERFEQYSGDDPDGDASPLARSGMVLAAEGHVQPSGVDLRTILVGQANGAPRMVRNEPERRTEISCSTEEAEVVRRYHAAALGADRVKVEPGRVLILDEPDLSLTLTEQMLLAQARGDDDDAPECCQVEPPRVLVLDAPNAKDNGVYDVGEDGALSRSDSGYIPCSGTWFSTEDIARMREPRVAVPGEPEPQIVVGVDPATGSSVTVAAFVDGTREIRDMMIVTNPANPRRIDRILPAAEMMNRAIVAGHMRLSAFQNEQLQVDEKIADLMARLDRLAKTIPRLAPTVEALLQRAANSDDTFGDLAVGLRRIQAGDEIVNGEWVCGSLGVTSPDEVRKIFEALSTAARDGAEAWKRAAAELSRIGFTMGDRYIERGPAGATENGVYVVTDVGSNDEPVRLSREEPPPVRPNRHERRKQAAIARRARR